MRAQTRRNLAKLEIYRKFTNTLAVSVLLSIALIGFELYFNATDPLSLKDYVLKHGNNLSSKCNSCFTSWEELKVGSGVACCTVNRLHTELVMEAVIVISNMSIQNTMCFREYGDKTETGLIL
ncbi:hypothetical protein P8452_58035 [Trifolium repens]|nr:hypothetical protein P8452_58035 [Trifolium repens]